MITAIALICSNVTLECDTISHPQFFRIETECRRARSSAEEFAASLDGFVADYRCINWGELS